MKNSRRRTITLFALLTAFGLVALPAVACGGDGEEAEPTSTLPPAATATTAPLPTTAGDGDHAAAEIAFDAASATIIVDGDSSDWDAIEGATVPMEQIIAFLRSGTSEASEEVSGATSQN